MADLSSILGGMVQGFKDFGTGLVDLFGTGGAAIGDAISSIQTGRATTKNQDDFRKWLYNTDSTKDAAAKGLGTALNGVSTVADVIPGAQAVTANPLFNGLQGAIGGISDELKMAGENADWGKAAQRAGVGAASGLASGYAGQALGKSGSKLLSNGLTRGAVSGALGGGIANAGYTGIEGGSVQDMINAGLYGAQTGALVGGTTGLARELIKPTHKMDVALTDEEKAARIANIDDQLGKLDTTTPEGNARYAELTAARENYEPKTYYHGSPETDITEFDINRAGKNTRSGEKAIYFTDTPEAAEEFAYERIPTDSIFMDKVGKRGGVYEANLDMRNTLDLDNLTDAQIRELWNYASPLGQLDGQEKFIQNMTDYRDKYHNAQAAKSLLDLNRLKESPYDSFSATMYPNTDNKAREYAIFDASKAKITKSPKTVADLMLSPDDDVMYSKVAEGQLGLFDQPMPTKPVEEALALDGKYSPKDNKVTKAMRARAEEIIGDYKTSKKVPENELYNKIDESTLPNKRKSTGAILDDLYSEGVKPDEVSNKVLDQLVEKEIGGKMDKKSLATYLFGDMDDTARKDFIKKNLYTTKDYDVDDLTESILKNWARRKAMASGTLNKYNIDNLAIVGGNKTVRQGYTGALDSALSERLGIAPGNTYKQNGEFDTPGALGRYIGSESRPDFNNYMVKEVPDIEEALNTAGHERLHSFQAESRLENRYSKEVADAYNSLASDLKKANAYKSDAEIKNRYKKGTEYWSDTDEQEARMLQQYLGARGFTDYNKRDAKMYGALEFDNDKIVPAFDKFFDKLRALSKKGVALPALTTLFGGGAIMAATQGDDKKKKSEVK